MLVSSSKKIAHAPVVVTLTQLKLNGNGRSDRQPIAQPNTRKLEAGLINPALPASEFDPKTTFRGQGFGFPVTAVTSPTSDGRNPRGGLTR